MSSLSHWFAPHPEWEPGENWPQEVLCVRLDTPGGTVLIDPLDAPDDLEPPVQVLLSAPWPARGTAQVVERHGASVWAPPRAHWRGPSPVTTEVLPAGVEALCPRGDDNQALFWLPEHRTLVTGDVFSGTGGRFHVFYDPDDVEVAPFLAWLPTLLELPVERVLIAHGEPVLSDGAARLREAIREANPSK